MARTDPSITVRLPQFVHDELDALIDELAADDANETKLIGALIHAASVAEAQAALRKYRADEKAWRSNRG